MICSSVYRFFMSNLLPFRDWTLNLSATQYGGDVDGLTIKSTTFEGAKGLSAQRVFILGMHDGDLPRDPTHIDDIQICRFVVGLTRTKKKCTLMLTRRYAGERQNKLPSRFLTWIAAHRFEAVVVDATYFARERSSQ